MKPLLIHRMLLCLLALAVLGICTAVSFQLRTSFKPLAADSFQSDAGDATAEMSALWEDNYEHLAEGMPPWPRGFSRDQLLVLQNADSVVVATVDPYRADADASGVQFHGHQVLGARAYRDQNDISRIIDEVIASTRDIPTQSPEFYPVFALRVTADTSVVDLMIGDFHVGMYVLTPIEKRFCVVDPRIGHLLRDVTRGLPQKYE